MYIGEHHYHYIAIKERMDRLQESLWEHRHEPDMILATNSFLDDTLDDFAALLMRLDELETQVAKLTEHQERVFKGELIPGVLALRIGDLVAQNARFLRYVRAHEEMEQADYETMTDEEADRIGYAVRDALADLKMHGDIAEDSPLT